MQTITLTHIQAARERIAAHIVQTPTARDETLGRKLKAEVWFKWENHQTTGSFKLRGALNKLLSLQLADTSKVIAASSGNHGQGVAYAAHMLGLPAVIYVPDDTPPTKMRGMAQLGAEAVIVTGGYGATEDAALAAARDSDALWVSAYNDPIIIAGQGTLALEWLEQVPALNLLLVPVGGGGLVSGIGLAAKAIKPDIHIIGVQAANSAALHEAFHGGDMDAVAHTHTLAHGLAGPVEAGSITVPLVMQVVDEMILVDEDEIAEAVAYAYHAHKEIIEGAGAVGLAALLAGKINCAGRVMGLLISGGNIDVQEHTEILSRIA